MERCPSLITRLVLSFIDLVAILNCMKVDINCLSSQKADVDCGGYENIKCACFWQACPFLDMRLFSRKIFENIVAAFTFVSRLALLHCYRLTGRRTEKDGNLAIWSRREHKKRTSGRIKVVTMLDEISSFFVYHPPRRHISQYSPPFFSSPRKLFTSVANYLETQMEAPTLLGGLLNKHQIDKFPF